MPDDHFFASDAFLEALARAYFPHARPEFVDCDGFVTRTLVHRGRPVTDFWQHPYSHPRLAEPGGAPRKVPFLQKAELAITRPSALPPSEGAQRAAFIDFREFECWAEYERFGAAQGMRTASVDRDERYLARDFGPVRFVSDDRHPETFDTIVRWKIADFARRNGVDRLTSKRSQAFHRQLQRSGLMTVSSLWAGERLVAGQFSHTWGHRTIYGLTTYDYALRKYSPGAIQMRHFLRQRFEAGDREVDFLWGEEPYKYRYATHVRWLGEVGREPRGDRWKRRSRMRAGRVLRRFPAAQEAARTMERAASRVLRL